eukprot:COSAG05_NODE_649_length_8102_cov_157.470823_9_plen_85_part_00
MEIRREHQLDADLFELLHTRAIQYIRLGCPIDMLGASRIEMGEGGGGRVTCTIAFGSGLPTQHHHHHHRETETITSSCHITKKI